jgi:transcriptional regulator with XRE-family HTH domain
MKTATAPDFPERVRRERARLGLTQAEAAARLGMVRGSYRQLEEHPPRDPRMSTLLRLVKIGYRIEAIAPNLTRTEC